LKWGKKCASITNEYKVGRITAACPGFLNIVLISWRKKGILPEVKSIYFDAKCV
jgi:hypothetical protein